MVEIRALASSVKFTNSVQLSVCMQLKSRQNKKLSSRGFAIFGGRLKNIKQARWISFGTYDDGRHFLLSLTDSPPVEFKGTASRNVKAFLSPYPHKCR